MVYSDCVAVIDFVDFKKTLFLFFPPVGCLYCLHIKNLTKKDWKKHESAQKDNRAALCQTEAAWGLAEDPRHWGPKPVLLQRFPSLHLLLDHIAL